MIKRKLIVSLLVLTMLPMLILASAPRHRKPLVIQTEAGSCNMGLGTYDRKLRNALPCAWKEARLQVIEWQPGLTEVLMSIKMPTPLLTRHISGPIHELGHTDIYEDGHATVAILLTGDLDEDFDTCVHEFTHYLVAMTFGPWSNQAPYHLYMDTHQHTAWFTRHSEARP